MSLRFFKRLFSSINALESLSLEKTRMSRTRNIGISAHIDSGKTTLTERILYYTKKISEIHEVRGKDGVGAKMDHMELEREKGITIQSAATFTMWKDTIINIIDTPGHVDFTIEVERALRVLDSAILVLCAVGGVQSQTITVDRQMKRYQVPRLAFINKLDRMGANPNRVIEEIRQKLKLCVAHVQVPIGQEGEFKGLVDLVKMRAIYFEGRFGDDIRVQEIPKDLIESAKKSRLNLVQELANIDDEMAEFYLEEKDPSNEKLAACIRKSTINRTFVPVFMGAAYKNVGVQLLLDGVTDYLPCPNEVNNYAIDIASNEKILLKSDSAEPLVSLAFKLEEGRYGQLTYMRIYQGTLKKGSLIYNMRTGQKFKVPRLGRVHANEMEDIDELKSGELGAMFGVDCASGDSFTDNVIKCSLTSIHVPEPVISLAIAPKNKDNPSFSKALGKFQKEDPTFRTHYDPESKETIISGMGELHLEIYLERMKREYNCECTTSKPRVAFRETITSPSNFDYTHKKQTGGAGQYGRVIGKISPIPADSEHKRFDLVFMNHVIGGTIPTEFIPAVEKGFKDSCKEGFLIGHPIVGVVYNVFDGAAHCVDSSELAFRLAASYAFKEAFNRAKPAILEPVMRVTISVPTEFQGQVISTLAQRRAVIVDTDSRDEFVVITADAPLNEMFGYSTEIRSQTQGKGEFSMEYKDHQIVPPHVQSEMVREYQKAKLASKN